MLLKISPLECYAGYWVSSSQHQELLTKEHNISEELNSNTSYYVCHSFFNVLERAQPYVLMILNRDTWH
jgi:hypothetical protein